MTDNQLAHKFDLLVDRLGRPCAGCASKALDCKTCEVAHALKALDFIKQRTDELTARLEEEAA